MRVLMLALAMAAAGGASAAQSTTAQSTTSAQNAVLAQKAMQTATIAASGAGMGCPVGFSARVNARAVARSVADETRYGNAPAVELSFMPKMGGKVVRASVTVHGLPVGSRVIPVAGWEKGASSEKFELTAAEGLWEREVRVTRLAVVRWAEVTEMTYADGTTWHPGQGETCRATPSLFREVNAVAQSRR